MKRKFIIQILTVSFLACSLISCSGSEQKPQDKVVDFKIGDPYKRINGIAEDAKNGFFDSFETLNKESWIVGQGYWGANNGGVSPDNVSILDNGVLALRGNGLYYNRGDAKSYGTFRDGRKCGGALISTFGVRPGHYEIKMKVFPRQGACTAFWTFANRPVAGQDNENAEIDIELPGGSKSGKITFKKALNTNWVTEPANDSVEYAISDVYPDADYVAYNDGNWHTFGFDWYTDPEIVVYYCDGIITNISDIFVPTLEGRLWLGVWFPNGFTGTPNFETDYMYVDYVMYHPFIDQPFNPFNAVPSVAAAGDSVYQKEPISLGEANKVSNGDFEYVGKIEAESDEEFDSILKTRGWSFSKKVSEKSDQKEVAWIEKGIGSGDGEGYAAFVKNGGVIRQSIDSVYDGYQYDVSFLAKADNANDENCYITINFMGNSNDDILESHKFIIDNANSFKNYTKQITAPVGTDFIAIEMRSGNGNRIVVDDISLTKIVKD